MAIIFCTMPTQHGKMDTSFQTWLELELDMNGNAEALQLSKGLYDF